MPLSKEAREVEAAARKISIYCNNRTCCPKCRFYLGGRSCLFMEYGPGEYGEVITDMKEREAAEREGKTWKEWKEIQQEKNGRKEN